jgi:protein TonB
MKNNKVLTYALIISILVHTLAILYILNLYQPEKKKKHLYTKPIIVQPYNFIKNHLKNTPKPKLATTIAHNALKNTRLNAPASSGMPAPAEHHAPYQARHISTANLSNRLNKSYKQQHKYISHRHISRAPIFSNNKPAVKQNNRLSMNKIYPMNKDFFNSTTPQSINNNQNSSQNNPSSGIKSATVNLNTTTIKYASYLLHVKEKIENVWEYPTRAERQGIQGVLVIKFSINQNGTVYNVKVLRSSGQKILDKAAVNAILNAARYNSFPRYWTIKRLNIIGTFIYRLNNFYLY